MLLEHDNIQKWLYKKYYKSFKKQSDLLSEKSKWFALLNLAFKLLCHGQIFCSPK